MKYLLWTTLNYSIAALLLYLIYRAIKFVYLRLGTIAAIVTFFIIISISASYSQRDFAKTKTWDFKTSPNTRFFSQEYSTSLVQNAVFDVQLHIITLSDKDRQSQEPLRAFSTMSGLVGYNDWTPDNISIHTNQDSIYYTISGRLDWKVLDFTVHSDRKAYSGSLKKL